jgi:uncharacterized protein (DUF305 family)
MKIRLIVFVVLIAAVMALAACGAEIPATEAVTTEATAEVTTETTAAATTEATPTHDMASMAPGEVMTGSGDMAGMDMSAANAFDLRFIDSMLPHHEGAVAMAQQALQQAEHPEIKKMAQQIIAAQEAEIKQLQDWRAAWYPDVGPTEGMQMDMGSGMSMMEVPAGDQPFDLRFIDSMIPHHQDAIMMAQDALAQAEHAEIKQMAQQIIAAQEAEIKQLQEWRTAWYSNR